MPALSRSFPASRFLALAALGAAGLAAVALTTRQGHLDATPGARRAAITGRVVDGRGAPVRAAFVTAEPRDGGPAVTVLSDGDGAFTLPVAGGSHAIRAHGRGLTPSSSVTAEAMASSGGETLTLEVRRDESPHEGPSSAWLGLLTDGEEKRRFIIDCTGCHQFRGRFAHGEGRPRTPEEWEQAVALMLSFAGPESGFPVIAHGREPEATATWLVEHLGGADDELPRLDPPPPPPDAALDAVITSYPAPPDELPHDVMLDPHGRVVVTGMFRGVMYRLDPRTGEIEEIALPIPQGGPRALEIEPDGTWWILLGGPQKLARRDVETGEWTQHDLGTHPHSVAGGADGRLWYNTHFGKDPAWIASLEPATGEIERFEIPPAEDAPRGTPMPYEIRVAPDGGVWGSELIGNRVFRFDPETERFRTWTMPRPHSAPRRLDIGPDGIVWIPEYAGNRLARLDPASGEIREFELPTPDALPYVVRVDQRTGDVWVAEAGADALALFDPATETFVEIPLPVTRGLVRHMDLDRRTGAVWLATAQAPPDAPTVLRVELPRDAAGDG